MGATQRPCLLVLPNCTESLTIGTLTTEPRLSLAYLEVTLSTEIWWVGLLRRTKKRCQAGASPGKHAPAI